MLKNKMKGFTLIELLAVIVILAIIALIATPIVINIIEDSKNNSMLRSADNYLGAVEQALAKENMSSGGSFNPNTCTVTSQGDLLCGSKELTVEVNGEKPNEGSIRFSKGNIEKIVLTYSNKTILKNENGELAYGEKPICTLVSDADSSNTITPGDKYQCKVKDDMEEGYEDGYYFYVLSTNEDRTTNLILDRNIYYDETNDVGLLSTSTNPGLVAWLSSTDYTATGGEDLSNDGGACQYGGSMYCYPAYNGPVTVMNYLYNATKNWNKVPNIEMNYTDKSYGTIKTTNGVTQITNNEGIIVSYSSGEAIAYKNLKSRLPYESEVYSYNGTNLWMYNYLNGDVFVDGRNIEGFERIDEIQGYWLLSTNGNPWAIHFSAVLFNSIPAHVTSNYGVRPVITLTNSNIF